MLYRLPRNIRPLSYDIHLRLDLENFRFSGSETIGLEISEPTKEVVLHASGLKIEDAHYFGLRPTKIIFNKEQETVRLVFSRNLTDFSENRLLVISFSGEINDKMHGLYRTSYEINGEKRVGVATQCEATHARSIFPCFDEPDLKAKFTLFVSAPRNLTVLSNMPPAYGMLTNSATDETPLHFQTTPLMPTYLFALVVAELECIEGQDKNNVPIRVWTTPGKKEFGRFALECAKHTLPYFTEYFGTPYPLPKLDMVALPDFAQGAMENWGLITYREPCLLVDPRNSSAQVKQRVAEVVDHEIAHMWFGNLVTMKWWDDLWLNEGFASYAGPMAIVDQFPEWRFWAQFVADDLVAALRADSYRHTHPIRVRVKNTKDIGSIFDAVSYSKGASLCRMLSTALGDSFRQGLINYLKQHSYGNAKTSDLWAALEKASGHPVGTMMNQFTRQSGYPVIIVKSAEKVNEGMELTLAQKPFLLDGRVRKTDKRSWNLPVAFAAGGRKGIFTQSVGARPEKVHVRCETGGWIKINPGQTGFYRVAYTDDLWQKLTEAAQLGHIPPVDRLGLVDDALALARAGYIPTSRLLGILSYFNAESDYAVWTAVADAYSTVYDLVGDLECAEKLKRFGRELFWPIAGTKGWDKDSYDDHLDVLKRSLVLYHLGLCGHKATIDEAKHRFWEFAKGGQIDPDIRLVVYSLAARYGSIADFEILKNVYDRAESNEEKVRILRALSHFTDQVIIEMLLSDTASDKVRQQDHLTVLRALGANPHARPLAWKFVKSRWEWLVENHGSDLSILGRIVQSVASGFKTAADLRNVRQFVREHKTPGLERTFKQTLEAIDSRIRWLERDQKDIEKWLDQRQPGVPG